MSMINYASREINCKIVYYGPGLGGKTTNLEHVYGKVHARHARQADLARDRDRAHALLRLPAGRPRHDSRLQDALPPLHRARPGVLQRQPQADPQGRGRHRVRRRLADRAHGSESGGDAEPVRQHGRVRLRSHEDAVRDPVQQARPAQRRADQRAAGALNPGWEVADAGQAAARRPIRITPARTSSSSCRRRMDRARAVLRGGGRHRRRRVRHAQGGQQAGAEDARVRHVTRAVRHPSGCARQQLVNLPERAHRRTHRVTRSSRCCRSSTRGRFGCWRSCCSSSPRSPTTSTAWLARSRKEETDLGRLLDPLADKLLLVGDASFRCTCSPRRCRSSRRLGTDRVCRSGSSLIVLGREVFMTVFRSRRQARRRDRRDRSREVEDGVPSIWQGTAYFWFWASTLATQRQRAGTIDAWQASRCSTAPSARHDGRSPSSSRCISLADLPAQLPSASSRLTIQVTQRHPAKRWSKSSRSATSCSSASRSTPTPRTSRASSRSIGIHIVRRTTVGDDAERRSRRVVARSARPHRRRDHHRRTRPDVGRSHQAVHRRDLFGREHACSTKSISRGWKSGGASASTVRCRRPIASRR